MNRLEYWIHADTQYNVHSPFMFDMYRKVLFARLSRSVRKVVASQYGERNRFKEMVYKLSDHYRLNVCHLSVDEALLEGDGLLSRVRVVAKPHRDKIREALWEALLNENDYDVSVDLFDVGLLITHPRLHRQHYLLK